MTTEEAIDTLEIDLRPLLRFLHKDYVEAIRLGIEALKEKLAREKGEE